MQNQNQKNSNINFLRICILVVLLIFNSCNSENKNIELNTLNLLSIQIQKVKLNEGNNYMTVNYLFFSCNTILQPSFDNTKVMLNKKKVSYAKSWEVLNDKNKLISCNNPKVRLYNFEIIYENIKDSIIFLLYIQKNLDNLSLYLRNDKIKINLNTCQFVGYVNFIAEPRLTTPKKNLKQDLR